MDLKVIQSVLGELEEERGVGRDQLIAAIEDALAAAYKREYGKKGQIIRAKLDMGSGETEFEQVKIVVDESRVRPELEEGEDETEEIAEGDERVRFNPEHHIYLEEAKKIKKGTNLDDELVFPLETKDDFGRIAAQTAKQVIIQKIREAEKEYLTKEFGKREGEIVTGSVQRIERGNIYVDLGRATGILPYEEQIPGERYKQGERLRAYLYRVDETPRGVFLRLSRSHPAFLEKLFEIEAPEIASGVVEIRAIAREAGSRSKIAVWSTDPHIDPVGSCVGQRGVRVSTVMSELGSEKVDVIEWSDDPIEFIEEALSPAKVLEVTIEDPESHEAVVTVLEDQQSLAIGKGGQNVRLAAKLTGWKIDIQSAGGESDETPTEKSDALKEETPAQASDEETPDLEQKEDSAEETSDSDKDESKEKNTEGDTPLEEDEEKDK